MYLRFLTQSVLQVSAQAGLSIDYTKRVESLGTLDASFGYTFEYIANTRLRRRGHRVSTTISRSAWGSRSRRQPSASIPLARASMELRVCMRELLLDQVDQPRLDESLGLLAEHSRRYAVALARLHVLDAGVEDRGPKARPPCPASG